jgi:hypothetical protein
VTGLRDALVTIAGSAHLRREAQTLRHVRSAAIELADTLRERLGAARREDAHLARIRQQRAAATDREAAVATLSRPRPDPARSAQPTEAARVGTAIDAARRRFDDRRQGGDTAALARLPQDLDVALAALAAACSRSLAFWAGRAARLAVHELSTTGQAPPPELWFNARVCDLCNLGEGSDYDRSLVVTDAPRPRPPWSNDPFTLGGSLPLPVAGFDVWLSADAYDTWHRLIAVGDPQVRSERARHWLHHVLDAAHTSVTAEVAHRSARLDAALAQALAQAHDRWRRRLDHQLADLHAARAPAVRDRVAATLAEKHTTVRDWIRRIDTVLLRVRSTVQSADAEAAEAAEELRPPH